MEKLKNIITDNKMSNRPEYYSGRGATTCDLNGDQLEGIFRGIKKEFGDEASDNFVKMVDEIQVISATTFLNELYTLFYSDWKYKVKKGKNKKDASGIAVHKDKSGNYDAMHGMLSIFGAMNNHKDETQQIKRYFCLDHGIKPKNRFEHDRRGNVIRYW